MGNYKPWAHDAHNFQGLLYNFKGGTPITLTWDVIPSTVGVSAHDNTDTVYTVPTGKKLRILSLVLTTGTAQRRFTMEYSDTADSATNVVILFAYTPMGKTVMDQEYTSCFTEAYAPAGKYINMKVASTSGTALCQALHAIEVDA